MTRKELSELIADLYGIPEINTMIDSQISKFIKQHGYTYKEIGRAVYFYVEVQGQTPKKEMGIGIVPHVMEEARKYFIQLEIEQNRLEEQGKIIAQETEQKVIKVKPVRKVSRYKINIEDL